MARISLDPLERLVMEYAEAMTETPPTVDDKLVARQLPAGIIPKGDLDQGGEMPTIVESIDISLRPEDVTSPNGRRASCRYAGRATPRSPWAREPS